MNEVLPSTIAHDIGPATNSSLTLAELGKHRGMFYRRFGGDLAHGRAL
jgi:hypothetical protein